jgi:predicted dehydrogenase
MVAQQLRYLPSYRGVMRLIQEGELGRIWGAQANYWLHIVLSRTSLPPRLAQNPEAARWKLNGKRSGGVAVIQDVHLPDLLRYFMGDAKRIFARCWTDHPLFTNGADDRAMATIEFESGAIAHFSTSWTARTPWSCQWMLLGEEGTVYTPYPPSGTGRFANQEEPAVVASIKRDTGEQFARHESFLKVEPVTAGLFGDNSYVNEIIHFAECCREGKEPVSSGRDNLGTMKIVFGIYESSRTGKMVDLSTL